MVRESEYAESGVDFIHKPQIAQKETNETLFWLELLFETEYIESEAFESMKTDTEEVLKLLTSSIRTKKKNLGIKLRCLFFVLASCHFLLF